MVHFFSSLVERFILINNDLRSLPPWMDKLLCNSIADLYPKLHQMQLLRSVESGFRGHRSLFIPKAKKPWLFSMSINCSSSLLTDKRTWSLDVRLPKLTRILVVLRRWPLRLASILKKWSLLNLFSPLSTWSLEPFPICFLLFSQHWPFGKELSRGMRYLTRSCRGLWAWRVGQDIRTWTRSGDWW